MGRAMTTEKVHRKWVPQSVWNRDLVTTDSSARFHSLDAESDTSKPLPSLTSDVDQFFRANLKEVTGT